MHVAGEADALDGGQFARMRRLQFGNRRFAWRGSSRPDPAPTSPDADAIRRAARGRADNRRLVRIDEQRLDARRAEIDAEIHVVPPDARHIGCDAFLRFRRPALPRGRSFARNRAPKTLPVRRMIFSRSKKLAGAVIRQIRRRSIRRAGARTSVPTRAIRPRLQRVRRKAPCASAPSPARNAASISVRSMTSRWAWLPPKRWAIAANRAGSGAPPRHNCRRRTP